MEDGLGSAKSRVSTEVTFWHSAEYGSDFRYNSGEITSEVKKFRGIPCRRNSVDTLAKREGPEDGLCITLLKLKVSQVIGRIRP
jgi:hypothetical protein